MRSEFGLCYPSRIVPVTDSDMHYSELAKRRRRMELSQVELAAALGVHWNTLARWERGDLTIVRPAWLKAMLDVIERERKERLSTATGREKHNPRMAAVKRHDLKTARRRGRKRQPNGEEQR